LLVNWNQYSRSGAGWHPTPTNRSVKARCFDGVSTRLRILSSNDGSRHTPVNVLRGATVSILSIISSRDPHGLAVSDAGCLREREAGHGRFGCELRSV
jgi:hypothetical protein